MEFVMLMSFITFAKIHLQSYDRGNEVLDNKIRNLDSNLVDMTLSELDTRIVKI